MCWEPPLLRIASTRSPEPPLLHQLIRHEQFINSPGMNTCAESGGFSAIFVSKMLPNSSAMNTCAKMAVKYSGMNTSKSVVTATVFRMNTYAKMGEGGALAAHFESKMAVMRRSL